jgi:hypothetical protein
VQNPIKGQKSFVEAFEVTSNIIQRFTAVEQTYQFEGQQNLQDAIIELYCRVLVFQARALRHLVHHTARKILSDTFKPEQWSTQRDGIKEQEKECDKALSDEVRMKVQMKLKEQSQNIENIRNAMRDSFKQQLDGIKVIRSMLFR